MFSKAHAQHVVRIHFPIALFVVALGFDVLALSTTDGARWTQPIGICLWQRSRPFVVLATGSSRDGLAIAIVTLTVSGGGILSGANGTVRRVREIPTAGRKTHVMEFVGNIFLRDEFFGHECPITVNPLRPGRTPNLIEESRTRTKVCSRSWSPSQ
jgi:uncharacterized membrane protein